MESVQTMRWILVSMTAVAGVVAVALGYVLAGLVLLLGVFLHVLHWYTRERTPAAAPGSPPVED